MDNFKGRFSFIDISRTLRGKSLAEQRKTINLFLWTKPRLYNEQRIILVCFDEKTYLFDIWLTIRPPSNVKLCAYIMIFDEHLSNTYLIKFSIQFRPQKTYFDLLLIKQIQYGVMGFRPKVSISTTFIYLGYFYIRNQRPRYIYPNIRQNIY